MRRPSSSMMRTWRRSKSGSRGALNSASTPSTLWPPCMTGHDRILYGTSAIAPCRSRWLAVIVCRCNCAQPIRCRWVRPRTSEASRGAVPSAARQMAMFLSGIRSAPTEQPRCSMQAWTSRSKSAGVSASIASSCAAPSSSSKSRSRVTRLRCRSPMLVCEESSRSRHCRTGRNIACRSASERCAPDGLRHTSQMLPSLALAASRRASV